MSWPVRALTIEARPSAAVLDDHADLIDRLRLAFGEAPQRFDELILSVVMRYASYVHDLPATAQAHFCAPGGLLRLGLEVGFYCLQGCDGRIFAGNATIERRRVLEPRWRLAAFIAGLCCELYRVPTEISVVAPDQRIWPSQTQPLGDWLAQAGVLRYCVQWRQTRRAMLPWGLLSLHHIVMPQTWAYLGQDNENIAADLLCSVAGLSAPDNVLDDLVRHALAVVVEQDLQRQSQGDGRAHCASHLKRFVLQAVRVLMTSHPRWQVNRDNGMILRSPDGVYLRWPHASHSLSAALAALGLPGLPKHADELLRQMDEIGMVSSEENISAIVPDTGEVVRAVRILDADWVLHYLPAPERGIAPIQPIKVGLDEDSLDVSQPLTQPSQAEQPKRLSEHAQKPIVRTAGTKKGARQFVASHQLPSLLSEALSQLFTGLEQDPEQTEVAEIAQGIFVTQAALQAREVNVAYAVRMLKDADLLAEPGFPVTMMLRGVQVTGLVLKRHCLRPAA